MRLWTVESGFESLLPSHFVGPALRSFGVLEIVDCWGVVQWQDSGLWNRESGFESLLPSQTASPVGNSRPGL